MRLPVEWDAVFHVTWWEEVGSKLAGKKDDPTLLKPLFGLPSDRTIQFLICWLYKLLAFCKSLECV